MGRARREPPASALHGLALGWPPGEPGSGLCSLRQPTRGPPREQRGPGRRQEVGAERRPVQCPGERGSGPWADTREEDTRLGAERAQSRDGADLLLPRRGQGRLLVFPGRLTHFNGAYDSTPARD